MDYFLFHNHIYWNDGFKVHTMGKASWDHGPMDKAAICVVDADVELASAPEEQADKKDSLLARKFAKWHPQNQYVLYDEKIEDNVFQVIGIKIDRIREIYALLPSEKVGFFAPYGLALRNFLISRNVELARGIIFIDDLGDEKLLTVYNGLKFSVTRTLAVKAAEDLLPEIKRSQIGFNKKIEAFDGLGHNDLTIVTNNAAMAGQLSGREGIKTHYIDAAFPAFEGLKVMEDAGPTVKFLLPEEIKNRRRKQEFKERTAALLMASAIIAAGLGFLLFNKIKLTMLSREYGLLAQQNRILGGQLADLDIRIYRSDLKVQKFLNYALPYFKVLNVLPLSYDIDSFKFYPNNHWNLEVYVFPKDGESFDDIPTLSIFKYAVINDYLIKDKPGKRIKIEL